jgi:hypothetical protein
MKIVQFCKYASVRTTLCAKIDMLNTRYSTFIELRAQTLDYMVTKAEGKSIMNEVGNTAQKCLDRIRTIGKRMIIIKKIEDHIMNKFNRLNDIDELDDRTVDDTDILSDMLITYIQARNDIKYYNKILKRKRSKLIRQINMPEYISENVIRLAIISECEDLINCRTADKGDLVCKSGKIECKCFTSDGPISFGPKESWTHLFIMDARNIEINEPCKIYRINLKNTDKKWKNIWVSETKTYQNQCDRGIRPRIGWDFLRPQIEEHLELIFYGHITELI